MSIGLLISLMIHISVMILLQQCNFTNRISNIHINNIPVTITNLSDIAKAPQIDPKTGPKTVLKTGLKIESKSIIDNNNVNKVKTIKKNSTNIDIKKPTSRLDDKTKQILLLKRDKQHNKRTSSAKSSAETKNNSKHNSSKHNSSKHNSKQIGTKKADKKADAKPALKKKQTKNNSKQVLAQNSEPANNNKEDFINNVFGDTKNNDSKNDNQKATELGELSANIIEAFIEMIKPCWSIISMPGMEKVNVKIYVELDQSGNITSYQVQDPDWSNPIYKNVANSATRALSDKRCQPFKLPAKDYKLWSKMIINFCPSDL